MTTIANRLPISEFALRAVARPGRGDWLVLVALEGVVGQIASRVKQEIAGLGDCSVEHIKDAANALELANAVHDTDKGKVLVISGLDRFSEEEWRHADLLRSRLGREMAVALVMSLRSIENLARNAPNLASWIGGSIWEVDVASESFSTEEKVAFLQSLREWSGLTDDEVIRRADEGTLPNEPEFVEWLVLLGRGDLLGNR